MVHPRTLDSLEYGKIIDHLANLCASEPGRELALAARPFALCEDARQAYLLYEEFCVWTSSDSGRLSTLASFPDTRGMTAAVREKIGASGAPFSLDLESFWALREMLRMASSIMTSIISAPTAVTLWPHLLQKAEAHPLPASLLAALNRCVSDDGLLKDESSPELFRLRTELRRLHQNCLRKVREFAQQYNMLPYLQDEFMTLSSDRYVLPLKANFKGRMQGIIHDWSQTGETCYFEPYFLVEINNRLQELKHEEREEERHILEYLTGLMDAELPGIENAASFLSILDYLQAVARLAQKLDARPVSFTASENGIELLDARHPLLTLARQDKPGASPVRPLDIILRPGERALIITGGNAGGKTVCLKTLGLLAAMAMSGLPIPARPGSHLPWFNRMDAFIGDEQSLAENVSTFSAQIDHLAKSFKYLDENGLALLDEFGAGTDPAEGAALAQAVHDELLKKRCFVLSATHFPALKSYALTKEGARAASMLFDPDTSRPLFRLAYDQVGSSQALAVAAEHGLPESILAGARHYLLQDGGDTSAILEKLNNLAALREKELASLRQQKAKAENILAEKREKLDREKKRLQEEVKEKIGQLMTAWREGKATAKQSLREMSGLRAELGLDDKDTASVLPQPVCPAVGQQVIHTGFHKRGVITDIDARRGRARVDLDGVSVWAEFRALAESGETDKAKTRATVKTASPGLSLSLDVRGQRAAEALAEVERFLDKALLAGSAEVEIIHGRGTGALRREIHNYLKTFPAVASISLAPEDRGGDGMTIVTFK